MLWLLDLWPRPPRKAKLDGFGILLAFLTAEEWLLETGGLIEVLLKVRGEGCGASVN